MSDAVREAVLSEMTKTLKLPTLGREYPAVARRAREEQWPYEDFLRDLLELEINSRRRRTVERRLKEARFPDLKTLEQIDWESLKGISALGRLYRKLQKVDLLIVDELGFVPFERAGGEVLFNLFSDRYERRRSSRRISRSENG